MDLPLITPIVRWNYFLALLLNKKVSQFQLDERGFSNGGLRVRLLGTLRGPVTRNLYLVIYSFVGEVQSDWASSYIHLVFYFFKYY